jgi:hypothetical protein
MKTAEQIMQTAYISNYSGYRHNRYDGYNCSWGVLMALGGSGTADCFADEDDYPDEEMDRAWNGDNPDCQLTVDDFRKSILRNLDGADIDEIKNLEPGEIYEHSEYWGDSIKITFENIDGKITCNFADYAKYICEF